MVSYSSGWPCPVLTCSKLAVFYKRRAPVTRLLTPTGVTMAWMDVFGEEEDGGVQEGKQGQNR